MEKAMKINANEIREPSPTTSSRFTKLSSNDLEAENKNVSFNNNLNSNLIYFNIFLGQFLAILGVGNATLSKLIEKDSQFVYPLLLTASYYFLLALFWILFKRKIKFPKLSYIFITIFDSQANFLNIYAFSVIHFNYPFIINISSVLWTCILTCLFIKNYKYKKYHIIGVILSMVGVGVSLFSSFRKLQDDTKFENLKGLFFSLGASVCYAISAVLQEMNFKSGNDIHEFFPWLGIIGTLITLGESFILNEIPRIIQENFTLKIVLLWSLFSVTLVIFTSIAPFFIKRSSAAMFNISLVSQIFWSYLVEVIFNESSPKGYEYYFGFVIIILGIYVFNKYPVTQLRSHGINILDDYAKSLISGSERVRFPSVYITDDKSESSSTSAFSEERKIEYYRTISLYNKTNKYLTEQKI